MVIKNVAIVGASGTLGPAILQAFQAAPEFSVSVLSRASSKAAYPAGIHEIKIPNDASHDELVDALRGQDALILTFSGMLTEPTIQLADAALQAGVKRIIPADWGSCDSSDPHTLALLPLYREKKRARDYLIELSERSGGAISWTTLINGHFLDWGLETDLFQVYVKEKRAKVYDDGGTRWSATTLEGIAHAAVGILRNEEATRNRILYVQSVSSTQNELLEAVEEVMGTKFEVERASSKKEIEKWKPLLDDEEMARQAYLELVAVEGVVNANWEGREGFSNELLGMPEVDLKDVVRRVVDKLVNSSS